MDIKLELNHIQKSFLETFPYIEKDLIRSLQNHLEDILNDKMEEEFNNE